MFSGFENALMKNVIYVIVSNDNSVVFNGKKMKNVIYVIISTLYYITLQRDEGHPLH